MQQVCFHVMPPTGQQPLVKDIIVTTQKEKKDIRSSRAMTLAWTERGGENFGAMEKDLSVLVLQSRACHQSIGA